MPDELEPDISPSDELETGLTNDADELDPQDAVLEPEVAQVAAEPAPKPIARTPVAHPGTVSPYAEAHQVYTDDERAELEAYLPANVIAMMENAARRTAQVEAQRAVMSFEQQQDLATDLGIPSQYMRDVKAYSQQVPEAIRGTKQGAQAAVLLGMHARAAADGGDLISEMENFVKAARPAPTPVPAVRKQPDPIQELTAERRVTRSSISGGVGAQPATAPRNGKDARLLAHFSFLKED